MPGPVPKPASSRRRRNKVATAAKLKVVAAGEVPVLPIEFAPPVVVSDDGDTQPAVEWHAATLVWWSDIWASPMSDEWDPSDIHGLYQLANLTDRFWREPNNDKAKGMAAEMRLQSQRFGTSPIDRRRLQWEIERGEEADEKTRGRRTERQADGTTKREDPRAV